MNRDTDSGQSQQDSWSLARPLIQGATRETYEEACAKVNIGHLFAIVDVISAGQVHAFYTADLIGDFAPGQESLDVKLFNKNDMPWDQMAFESGVFALRKLLDDDGKIMEFTITK